MKRGEIWEIRLPFHNGESTVPHSQLGVILSGNALGAIPMRIVVPITEWKERYAIAPWIVKLTPTPQNGLNSTACADTFQLCLIPAGRFIQRMGEISKGNQREIDRSLLEVLAIEPQ